mmetsp:Transcript_31640/g.122493  ORF Transcript_31640/g.122493 Transcript_31640/m.122493 type:complete len:90 (+) Transcript_31640:2856-3125(+)
MSSIFEHAARTRDNGLEWKQETGFRTPSSELDGGDQTVPARVTLENEPNEKQAARPVGSGLEVSECNAGVGSFSCVVGRTPFVLLLMDP